MSAPRGCSGLPRLAMVLLAAWCSTAAATNGTVTAITGSPNFILLTPSGSPQATSMIGSFCMVLPVANDPTLTKPMMLYTGWDTALVDDAGQWFMADLSLLGGYSGLPTGDGYARIGFDGTVLKSWSVTLASHQLPATVSIMRIPGTTKFCAVKWNLGPPWGGSYKIFVFDETQATLPLQEPGGFSGESKQCISAYWRGTDRLVLVKVQWGGLNDYCLMELQWDDATNTFNTIRDQWYYGGAYEYAHPHNGFVYSNGLVKQGFDLGTGRSLFGKSTQETKGAFDLWLCDLDFTFTGQDIIRDCFVVGSGADDKQPSVGVDPGNRNIYVLMTTYLDIDGSGPMEYSYRDQALFAYNYDTLQLNWTITWGDPLNEDTIGGHIVPTDSYLYYTKSNKVYQYPFCPPGFGTPFDSTQDEHVKCLPCHNGRKISGQNTCEQCFYGTYTPPSHVSYSECLPCEAGTYADEKGLSHCKDCPAGEFAAAGAERCTVCPAGSYTSTTRTSSCSLCPQNTFGNATGMTSCHPCPLGSTSPRGSTEASLCVCDAGTFGDPSNGIPCRPCPDEQFARCLYGGNIPSYYEGYYAYEADPYTVYECIPAESCPEGMHYETCADGYTGTTCSECDTGYFRAEGLCKMCAGSDGGIESWGIPAMIVTGILSAVVGIPITLIVWVCVRHLLVAQLLAVFVRRLVQSVGRLSRFAQIVTLTLAVDITWPASFDGLLAVVGVFNFSVEAFQLGCSLRAKQWTVLAYNLKIIIPVFVVLTNIIFIVVTVITRKTCGRAKSHWFDKLEASLVSMTYTGLSFMYVFLSGTSVGLFGCYKSSGKYTWVLDPEIECYVLDGFWAQMLPASVVGMVVFSFGIPFWFMVTLIVMYPRRHNPFIAARFGVIWKSFDDWAYFWELVNMTFRFLMTMSVVMVAAGPQDQLMYITLITLIFSTVYYFMKPLKLDLDDAVESTMYFTFTVTVFVGILTGYPTVEDWIFNTLIFSALSLYVVTLVMIVIATVYPEVRRWMRYYHLRKGTEKLTSDEMLQKLT